MHLDHYNDFTAFVKSLQFCLPLSADWNCKICWQRAATITESFYDAQSNHASTSSYYTAVDTADEKNRDYLTTGVF